MRSSLLFVLPAFLAATSVSAHGIVTSVTVAGKSYAGLDRGEIGAKGDSVVRQLQSNSPVPGVNSKDMACGTFGGPATLSADANPGDQIGFSWSKTWPHEKGPIIHYMASCGDAGCESFDASQAKWFKIDQQGIRDDGSWVQADVKAGKPVYATIPQNIAPGNYLIRHEIIALHNAGSPGGAEFYPSCTQLTIGGSGTGVPSADELVSFPGAYKAEDPGILINAYGNLKNSDYRFPGPAISKLAGSASSGSSNGNNGGGEPAAPAVPTVNNGAADPAPTTAEPAPTTPAYDAGEEAPAATDAPVEAPADPSPTPVVDEPAPPVDNTEAAGPTTTTEEDTAPTDAPAEAVTPTDAPADTPAPSPAPAAPSTEPEAPSAPDAEGRPHWKGRYCRKWKSDAARDKRHPHWKDCERWVSGRVTGKSSYGQ